MDRICRLCYIGKPIVSLFDDSKKLCTKITACLPVKIHKNDNLPKLICDVCHNKIEDYYQFCLTTLETEKRLLELNQQNVESETPVYKRRRKEKTQMSKSRFRSKFLQVTEAAKESDHVPFDVKLTNLLNDHEEVIGVKEEIEEEGVRVGKHRECKIQGEEEKCKEEGLEDDKDNFDNLSCSTSSEEEFFAGKKYSKSKKHKSIGHTARKKKLKIENAKSANTDEDSDVSEKAANFEYNCCICFFKNRGRDKMLEHYKRHNKASSRYYNHPTKATHENGVTIEIFECNLCQSVFQNRKEFLAHYTMHRTTGGYKCSLCDKSYSNTMDILKHGLTHTYDEINKECDDEDKPKTLKLDPSEMRFLCELCDAKFAFFKSAKDHRVFDHPENQDPFLVRCVLCKEKFPTYWMIRKHLRSHREKLKSLCTICGKYLANNHKLNMHLRIHLGLKPFVCSVCSKGFVNSSRLREHERVHSGDRPYKCECGKKFTQRSSLVIHMRSHSGDRPYTCNICQRGFISRGLLTVHQKSTCI